jgi:two-component system response regulator NreC
VERSGGALYFSQVLTSEAAGPRRRVVVADDHPAVLIALTRILEPHVDVVAAAVDGEDLLRQVGNLLPDAVVTDLSMPRMNGLDACRHICRMYPDVRVVIVSELLDDDELTAGAFERGASAVVCKTQMVRELPSAVLALFGPAAGGPVAGARSDLPRG